MNDTQMIDWIQHHATALRLQNEDAFRGSTYCLEWIDNEAITHKTTGCDLRDCVRGAVSAICEV